MPKNRTAAIAVVIGLIGLLPLLRSDRFQSIRTVDALQLLASGACFGVAIVIIVGRLRGRSGS